MNILAKPLGLQIRRAATRVALAVPQQKVLSFNNHFAAYGGYTNMELLRKAVILKACQSKFLVSNSSKGLQLMYNVLGKKMTNALLRPSIFGLFCGGEDLEDTKKTIKRLEDADVGVILDYAAELELDHRTAGVSASNAFFDANTELFLKCIDVAMYSQGGFIAVKATALFPPTLLTQMSSVMKLLKDAFFDYDPRSGTVPPYHDIEAVLHTKVSCQTLIDRLAEKAGEAAIASAELGILDPVALANNQEDLSLEPLAAVTFARAQQYFTPELLLSLFAPREAKDLIAQWSDGKLRLMRILEAAKEKNVRILIDAEHCRIQPAIDWIALDAIERTSTATFATAYNTYQAYLQDSHIRLQFDYARLKAAGKCFGVKLVRGAYLRHEREDAKLHQYRDPTNPTLDATHESYNRCAKFILDHKSDFNVIFGSHNEYSIKTIASRLMNEENEQAGCAQLYAMADNISFPLAKSLTPSQGAHRMMKVYKYLPFGPIEFVVPYLVRRAEENLDMLGTGARELPLVRAELVRRLAHSLAFMSR